MGAKTATIPEVRLKVAEELQKKWLDLKSIKGWLSGYKGIPQEAQEEIAKTIQALFAEYELRPDLGHIVILGDRPYVTREGLLYYARKTGQLQGIRVEIVERGKGYCIVKATVLTKDGGEFEALGDASESNTNRMVSPHLIRMAETRAINRALREAFPIGLCSYEELSEEDITERDGVPEEGTPKANQGATRKITEKQLKFIWSLANQVFGENKDQSLHKLIESQFGKTSSKELTPEEASKLIDILKKAKENVDELESIKDIEF